MNPILKNILIFIGALIVGMLVNGGIVSLSPLLIDFPDGFDPMDQNSYEQFKDSIPNSAYILALLAHGLGTLVGAFIVAKFATTKNLWFALGIAVLFLLGGIANIAMIPGPSWFPPVDLILCYIPMGYLGWILAGSKK